MSIIERLQPVHKPIISIFSISAQRQERTRVQSTPHSSASPSPKRSSIPIAQVQVQPERDVQVTTSHSRLPVHIIPTRPVAERQRERRVPSIAIVAREPALRCGASGADLELAADGPEAGAEAVGRLEAGHAAVVCVVGGEVLGGGVARVQESEDPALIVAADLVGGGGAGGINGASGGRGVGRCLSDAVVEIGTAGQSDE